MQLQPHGVYGEMHLYRMRWMRYWITVRVHTNYNGSNIELQRLEFVSCKTIKKYLPFCSLHKLQFSLWIARSCKIYNLSLKVLRKMRWSMMYKFLTEINIVFSLTYFWKANNMQQCRNFLKTKLFYPLRNPKNVIQK